MKSNIYLLSCWLMTLLLLLLWPGGTLTLHANTQEVTINDNNLNSKMWMEPVTKMEFIQVKGGCYQMGCGNWTSECKNDEIPVHEVCLDTYWIGKFEVTQAQWQKIMGRNPAYFKLGDDHPVETISWEHAQQFITRLNKKTKLSFRLPTEAEWEYAARSRGKDEKYAGGNKIANFSWCSFNSGQTTQKIGGKKPNGLGIYDMSGNVSEWVQDYYQPQYYSKSPKNNPKGPKNGEGRIHRGGCWGNVPGFLRVVGRDWNPADIGINTIGMRIILPKIPSNKD